MRQKEAQALVDLILSSDEEELEKEGQKPKSGVSTGLNTIKHL